MTEIKTIIRPTAQAWLFDADVNRHTAGGWIIKKREVLKLPSDPSEAFSVALVPVLYAELQRERPPWPEEVTD